VPRRSNVNPAHATHSFSAFAAEVGTVRKGMIRPVLTELALFVAPFAIYAIFLWATRAGVLHPDSWPLGTLIWLTGTALLLVLGSFIVLAHFSGSPPGSGYEPAHIEDGKLVPGRSQ
jgi:heme/copper-type cytochrome/quinol oxidase subunit 3